MSSLDNGFIRQTIAYAGNDYFPLTSFVPQKHGQSLLSLSTTRGPYVCISGQDPIIGGPPPKDSPGAQRVAGLEQPFDFKTGDQVNLALISGAALSDEIVEVSGFVRVTKKSLRPPPGADNPFFVTSRGGGVLLCPVYSDFEGLGKLTFTFTIL